MRLVHALSAILINAGCAGAAAHPPRTVAHDEPPSSRAGEALDAPGEAQPRAPRGSLGRAVIRAVIVTAHQRMRRCYETTVLAGPEPWAEGRVMTSFIIGPDGGIQAAGIAHERTQIPSPALQTCMLGVLRTLRFPEPDGGGVVGVNYPWTFSVSNVAPPLVTAMTLTPEAPEHLASLAPQLRVGADALAECVEPPAVSPEVAAQVLDVRVRFDLTGTGTVENLELVSLPAALGAAAECLQRKLAARRYDLGSPIPVQVEMTVRFGG